ncbi:FAD-dependent thymidylate synthase [bacterium]|nr:FAD-dependent thymidylate synthase [bacterium]
MQVSLLSNTANAERIVASCGRLFNSDKTISNIFSELSEEKIKKVISDLIHSENYSVLDHVTYTFSIEEISEIVLKELALCEYLALSKREEKYISIDSENDFVISERIKEDEKLLELYQDFVEKSFDLYNTFIRLGLPREDAMYVLPSSKSENIVITMTASQLFKFFSDKCCKKASKEIRKLAWQIFRECVKISPAIFEHAGPACFLKRKCPYGDFKCFSKMKKVWTEEER